MMETTKLFLLFCLVTFGAYSEYQAGKTVQLLRAKEKKSGRSEVNSNDQDAAFMRRALELSYAGIAEGHGDRFGSFVVKDGKIVGEGWNKNRISHDPSAHAEVESIGMLQKNYRNKILEVPPSVRLPSRARCVFR